MSVAPKPQSKGKGTETTAKRSGLTPWKPGQSGNPAGRPKGSRHKLEEAFVADLVEVWHVHGKDALERTAAKEPAKFAQIAASILPKQTQNTRIHKLELMTDKELAEVLAQADAEMEASLIGRQGMN
jgi:hypothetical protein